MFSPSRLFKLLTNYQIFMLLGIDLVYDIGGHPETVLLNFPHL